MFGGKVAWVVTSVLVVACGPSKQATEPAASASVAEPASLPPGPPEPEKIATGHECATAEALCDGAVCTLKLKNGCDNALTCEASMVLRCQAGTDIIEASARGRQTFAQKSDADLHMTANCTTGSIVQSSVTDLKCK